MIRILIAVLALCLITDISLQSQDFAKDTLWSATVPHNGTISAKLMFHPDGNTLFATSDHYLYEYRTENGLLLKTRMTQSGSAIIDYQISRDTQTIFLLTRQYIEIWDIKAGFTKKIPLKNQGVTSFAVSSDNTIAFIGYYNRGLEKMSLISGEVLTSTLEVGYEISLKPDESEIVCFYAPMTHRTSIVNTDDFKIIHTLPPTTHTPQYSADGKYIIGIASNNSVSIYDRTENKHYTLSGHKGKITGICFAQQGKYIFTSSVYEPKENHGYRIWDIEKKQLYKAVPAELNAQKIAHSPHQSLFALSSGDTGKIILCKHEDLP